MKKHRHNLTPQDHKSIVEKAAQLPQLVRLNSKGEYMSRQVTKTVKGKDLPEGTKLESGRVIDPNKLYVQRINEPLYINHQVEMISAFWDNGPQGVIDYIQRVEAIAAKAAEEGKEAEI